MDDLRDLMFAEDSIARADVATDLSIPLVVAGGLSAVTPGAVAVAAKCTRHAVHQWFGGQESLRRAVAARFTARRTHWADVRVHHYGLPGLLPDCDAVVEWERVWLAVVELGLRDPEVADCIGYCRAREVETVTRALRRRLFELVEPTAAEIPASAVTELRALIQGFCVELCQPEPAITFADASQVLTTALERVARQLAADEVA